MNIEKLNSWQELKKYHAEDMVNFNLRQAFDLDENRAEKFTYTAPHIYADLSKNYINDKVKKLLEKLAIEKNLPAYIKSMQAGDEINISEKRSVTHTYWRESDENKVNKKMRPIYEDAINTREQMLKFARELNKNIKDVVNIGIGGSDLGPRLVMQALQTSMPELNNGLNTKVNNKPRVHYVSNMDGHQINTILKNLKPENTLFIIVSKTFSTAETLQNAKTAKNWFLENAGNKENLPAHFIAVSSNKKAAKEFGAGQCFSFDDGVGGRFSLWSPVGLSIALGAGDSAFTELLSGANEMDDHFLNAPIEKNLPIQLALQDIWYRNFYNFDSRCIVPYSWGMRNLPSYLQQLEMESNGKSVDIKGVKLTQKSAGVTWGNVGSNGQHAFFQMLHQGMSIIPLELILIKNPAHQIAGHHTPLLANALAQARALMTGQKGDVPERNFAGNRPSSILLMPDLSPKSIGALLAMYEHRAFTAGVIWGVNSFDQWGVELGKSQAKEIQMALEEKHFQNNAQFDQSTAKLIKQIQKQGF